LTTEPPLRREASPRRRARQTGTGRRRHRRLHGPRRGPGTLALPLVLLAVAVAGRAVGGGAAALER